MDIRKANAAPLLLEVGVCTDVGLARHENQDAWGKFPPIGPAVPLREGHLLVVADGMGGHERGQEASRLAVKCLHEVFFSNPEAAPHDRLRTGIEQANARVYELAQQDGNFAKIGTTCTVLALSQKEGALAHVGDSRAYRVRDGKIQQLTQDHTKVAEMQRHGILKEEEARHHPARSVLVRAVGVAPTVEVDVEGPWPLRAGDVYVLCTDGLGHATPEEIREAVLSSSPQDACDALLKLALERGGEDNITVMVARLVEESARGPEAPRTSAKERATREPAAKQTPAPVRRQLRPGVLVLGAGLLLALVGVLVWMMVGGRPARSGAEGPAPVAEQVETVEQAAQPARTDAAPAVADQSAAFEANAAVDEGDRLLAEGETDLAVVQYQDVLRTNPLHMGALDGLGRATDSLVRQGDAARAQAGCAQALPWYRRAQILRPADVAIQQRLASCEAAR